MKEDKKSKNKILSRTLNIVGIIAIIIAVVLYSRELEKKKEQAKSADLIRMFGATPIINMGIHLDLHGAASNQVFMVNDPDIVTNITHHLTLAKPTDFPSTTVEGDEYIITMIFTNHTHIVLRAARLFDDPDNLYIGAKQPAEFDENNKPVRWIFTPPALVCGLGEVFRELADTHVPHMRENAQEFDAAMSDLLEQVRSRAEMEKVKSSDEDSEQSAVADVIETPADE
jgi:hypothetical protein